MYIYNKIKKQDLDREILEEQVREIVGEVPDEDLDDERTVNTNDFGNQNESDIKPGEIEELIDEEEDRRKEEDI
jgi:hypothetical protein